MNVILYFPNKKANSITSLIIVDPEGEMVLKEVHAAARENLYLKVLLLPGDAHRTINALLRASDILLQETINEGFGRIVAEAMWKNKPVIAGMQVVFEFRCLMTIQAFW